MRSALHSGDVDAGATPYQFTRNNHQLACTLIREAESGIRPAVDAEGQ